MAADHRWTVESAVAFLTSSDSRCTAAAPGSTDGGCSALWAAMKGIMKNPVDAIAQFQVCSVRLNLGGDFMEELVEICGWLSQRADEGPARIQGDYII